MKYFYNFYIINITIILLYFANLCFFIMFYAYIIALKR